MNIQIHHPKITLQAPIFAHALLQVPVFAHALLQAPSFAHALLCGTEIDAVLSVGFPKLIS